MYSILITSYECHGKGVQYLRENLESVFSQTYRPIQCVVSDHSRNDDIETMVRSLDPGDIDFMYVRYNYHYGNPAMNWKNALLHASGDYLHYLAMDDKFAHKDAVADVVRFFEKHQDSKWIATGHVLDPDNYRFTPKWNDNILQCNTISGPSAVIIRSDLRHIEMDPIFIWYLDLDWYYRLWKTAGPPTIFDSVVFINRRHEYQLTNTVCDREFCEDQERVLMEKYGKPLPLSI